jgi:hypothetical protein
MVSDFLAFCTTGLLSNGDFETAPAGGFVKSASVAEGASSIPGWTINGTVELISAGQHQGGMILIVPQGIPSELLSLFFSPIVVLKHLYFRGRGPCCKARE